MLVLTDAWGLAGLGCKLVSYAGIAAVVGGSICLWLYSDGARSTASSNLRYITLGAVLGLLGTILHFFVQVGTVADAGLMGMFDWTLAVALSSAQLGEAALLQIAGFSAVCLVGLIYLGRLGSKGHAPSIQSCRLLLTLNLLAFLPIALSFRLTGHVSVLNPAAKLAIGLHVFAFAAWIGSLYPLHRIASLEDVTVIKRVMQKFGHNALSVVLLLIAAGVLMVLELFHSLGELFTTAYGRVFLAKLLLVLAIMMIAAFNKYRLTPRICRDGGPQALQRSIRAEGVVAVLILVVTSILTTIVGPTHH